MNPSKMKRMKTMNEQWIKDYLKRFPCMLLKSGNIRTCPVRLSFPQLFEAKAAVINGVEQPPKYSTMLLFPKGADLTQLVQAAIGAANDEWGDKWKAKLPNGRVVGSGKTLISFPFRDGEEKEDQGGFEPGAYFFNARSDTRPGLVDARAQPINDHGAIYGGVWALVTLRPFAFNVDVNKGISFGLQNVQKIADDEPLGSMRPRAEDEFEPLDDEDAGPGHKANGASDSIDGLGNLAGL